MPNKEILDRGCTIDPNQVPKSLTKNELSRQAKIDHLARLHVSLQDAKEILDKLYGLDKLYEEGEPMKDPTFKNKTPRLRPRTDQIGHIHIHKNGMVSVADPDGNDLPQFGGPSEEVLPLLLEVYGGRFISYEE